MLPAGLLALHRSRLWEWSPSTVVAISACPETPLAAVGYETGDLELWDLLHMACVAVGGIGHLHSGSTGAATLPAVSQRVPGDGIEITALDWARDSLDGSWRLLCASLNGTLSELLWPRGQHVSSTDSGAGAIW